MYADLGSGSATLVGITLAQGSPLQGPFKFSPNSVKGYGEICVPRGTTHTTYDPSNFGDCALLCMRGLLCALYGLIVDLSIRSQHQNKRFYNTATTPQGVDASRNCSALHKCLAGQSLAPHVGMQGQQLPRPEPGRKMSGSMFAL